LSAVLVTNDEGDDDEGYQVVLDHGGNIHIKPCKISGREEEEKTKEKQ